VVEIVEVNGRMERLRMEIQRLVVGVVEIVEVGDQEERRRLVHGRSAGMRIDRADGHEEGRRRALFQAGEVEMAGHDGRASATARRDASRSIEYPPDESVLKNTFAMAFGSPESLALKLWSFVEFRVGKYVSSSNLSPHLAIAVCDQKVVWISLLMREVRIYPNV
jgi:hypothetical protein